MAPRLRAAAAGAAELVALGESRSRNLLTIRAAQRRMDDRLAAVDALLAAGPTPARFAPALDAYHSGATAVRRAMAEAQAGFLRLDWDRVARATDLLADAAAALDRAAAILDAAAATPSPSWTPGPASEVAPDVL